MNYIFNKSHFKYWGISQTKKLISRLYLDLGSDELFFLRGGEVKRSDLVLHLRVEGGLPELLTGPDGMVLYAGVGELVHASCQFL